MEEKNGVHSEFLHPNPAHCVRVEIMPEDNSKPHTAYLNIAQNKMVSQSRCERDKKSSKDRIAEFTTWFFTRTRLGWEKRTRIL